eukprot:CAMPEP_0184491248 /NCGR_PEP_ID=MMETSP0113_2-20130426/19923_1 /TAXON_ID=91329 /ORGANISM="Norrisiella sphaerica, Strain BC52" /LENGTH=93 /DNA_ID=CAMNT_0026875529 /DNA_START=351 /DNA_END=632 /DNA_ORIENTATION=-
MNRAVKDILDKGKAAFDPHHESNRAIYYQTIRQTLGPNGISKFRRGYDEIVKDLDYGCLFEKDNREMFNKGRDDDAEKDDIDPEGMMEMDEME